MRWWVVTMLAGACAAGPDALPDVTYHRDVRPILEAECASCHEAGGIAPFDVAYEAAAWSDGAPHWAASAAASVADGSMPPWMADEDCHPVADARTLSDEDRATVAAWAEAGFPEGDAADFVPRADPADALAVDELGAPDLELRAAEAYRPSTERPDDYRCFVVDHSFEEDAWIRAVTVAPDQIALVHHVILYRLEAEYADDVVAWDAADEGPGYTCFGSPGTWDADTVAGWAPGQQPEVYEPGVARRVAAGSTLVVQVHYNVLNLDGAEAPEDRTAVRLWLAPERPEWQLYSFPLADTSIRLPAGQRRIVEKEEFSFGFLPFDVTAVGVLPHMHQLGKEIRLDLVREEGGRSCVVNVPRWDFNWQQSYYFPPDDPIIVRPTDVLRLTCVYDNSAAHQPTVNGERQEPRDVAWGDGSLDEMCLMYAHVLVPPGFL